MVRNILTCFTLSFFTWANAQIVNIENYRMNKDSVGWEGAFELGFNGNKTTKNLFSLFGGSQIQYLNKRHLFLSSNEIALIISGAENFENRGFQHFRYNYGLHPKVFWEAFTQGQFDQVLRIQFRWLTGTGPRFGLLKKDNAQIFLGTLYMYEYEEEQGTGIINRDHRLSNYISLSTSVKDVFSINHINYYQPRLDRFKDFRFSSSTELKFKIIKQLFFSFSANLMYDAYPVVDADIPNLTWNFRNSISITF